MTKNLIFLLFPALLTTASAQLLFDKPEYTEAAKLNQIALTTDYAFANKGSYPVKITGIRTTCGCTTTKLAKDLYKPGESGSIQVKMTFGTAPGHHEKYIYVNTDDAKNPTYKLTVAADVPEILKMEPSFLLWNYAEEPLPKTVDIKVVYSEPVNLEKIESTNPNWTTKLEVVKAGREYKLTMTPPKDTTQVSRVVLSLPSDLPKENPLVFKTSGRVARKREKPKTNWLLELLR